MNAGVFPLVRENSIGVIRAFSVIGLYPRASDRLI